MLPPASSTTADINSVISITVREEWGRLLASLISGFGDIQLCEDVLQDAVAQALSDWQQNGVPESPAAWLLTTARRKAIDKYRRDKRFSELQPDITYLHEIDQLDTNQADAMQTIPDKRLELMFTCCHPALDKKSQVALTLRTIAGLTVDEIASAFLDKPSALAKRLTRAKQKIALAGIPYGLPHQAVLDDRIEAILSVIYLIFNEGYSASTGDNLFREELSEEAIRLARTTFSLMPEHLETGGLLALMLLHDSRRPARQTQNGEFISLEDQDRTLWDKKRALEGRSLIQSLLPYGKVGSFQLQASISALHTEANTWQETDWTQIAALYKLLHSVTPTPVVHLNWAISVSYAQSPDIALDMLSEIGLESSMQNYQPYHAACADVLKRANQITQAQQAYLRAIELTENEKELHYLQSKLLEVGFQIH